MKIEFVTNYIAIDFEDKLINGCFQKLINDVVKVADGTDSKENSSFKTKTLKS